MTGTYQVFLIAGLAVAATGTLIAARLGGLPWPRAIWPVFLAIPAAVIGARLLNFLLYSRANPSLWLSHLESGSLTLYGGALTAVLVIIAACRLLRLPVRRTLDLSAPAAGLGIAAARIGCAINGCCFGLPTSLPWGVVPPYGGTAHQMQLDDGLVGHFLGLPLPPLPIHPAQIYEMIAALIASGLALWLVRRHTKPGVPTAIFGLTLSALRLLIFQVRAFPGASPQSLFIRGPVIYGLSILLSLLLLFFSMGASSIFHHSRRSDLGQ